MGSGQPRGAEQGTGHTRVLKEMGPGGVGRGCEAGSLRSPLRFPPQKMEIQWLLKFRQEEVKPEPGLGAPLRAWRGHAEAGAHPGTSVAAAQVSRLPLRFSRKPTRGKGGTRWGGARAQAWMATSRGPGRRPWWEAVAPAGIPGKTRRVEQERPDGARGPRDPGQGQ